MRFRLSHSFVPLALVAALTLVGLALTGPTATASGHPRTSSHAVGAAGHRGAARGYLALGDSVAFGYREAASNPAPDYNDPTSLVGFPEDLAAAQHLKLTNAACPGETTASMIKKGAASNGCENAPGGQPGYRDQHPLHVKYSGTQLAYALKYLHKHPGTRLVSLMIGANDGLLCQETTSDGCASELPAVLSRVGRNVGKIFKAIRQKGGYQGRIVVVTYYSPNYADPFLTGGSKAINDAITAAAKPYDVSVANGFKAFNKATKSTGGSACTAGLLTQLTAGGCGIHPSALGQSLLEKTVAKALKH